MTILHNVEPPLSLKGCHSESQCCIDCGYNTNPGAPPRELAEFLMNRDGEVPMTLTRDSEFYAVRNEVWKAAGMEPWGGCLCVGCLERRIGRRLKPKDFELDHEFNNPGLPRSDRLSDRLGYWPDPFCCKKQVTFKKGTSGNPAGKKPGTLNGTTVALKEQILHALDQAG